ncbi:MAG: dsDNA nuclease domain-containing protein [Gemmata sp.]
MAKAPGKAAKSTATKQVSFRDLDPIEQGGRVARDGFDFQDHVAAGKCLDMLLGGGPVEVWCEAEDDIVQVWLDGTAECFEFVQVKGNDLKQTWTVPKLGELEIAKKSLAHDRADEKCRFRLVTRWKPDDTLSPLTADFGTEARTANATGITACGKTIEVKLGACTSPNGNGLAFWAEMTAWEVKATTQDVRNENLLKLQRVLEAIGVILDSEQRERLYERLFLRVQDASLACGRTQKDAKRQKKAELLAWLKDRANDILHPKPAGTSATLERKLNAARIPSCSVEAAKEQRRRYLHEIRTQKYLSLESREEVEDQAFARLHRLRTQLDAGQFSDDGPQFLDRCQQMLLDFRDSLPGDLKPPDSFMLGYLYEVMNLCRHELVRASA